jgi:hypothetical protein
MLQQSSSLLGSCIVVSFRLEIISSQVCTRTTPIPLPMLFQEVEGILALDEKEQCRFTRVRVVHRVLNLGNYLLRSLFKQTSLVIEFPQTLLQNLEVVLEALLLLLVLGHSGVHDRLTDELEVVLVLVSQLV